MEINPDNLPMDTSKLCPYYFNGTVTNASDTGAPIWLFYRNTCRSNVTHFEKRLQWCKSYITMLIQKIVPLLLDPSVQKGVNTILARHLSALNDYSEYSKNEGDPFVDAFEVFLISLTNEMSQVLGESYLSLPNNPINIYDAANEQYLVKGTMKRKREHEAVAENSGNQNGNQTPSDEENKRQRTEK